MGDEDAEAVEAPVAAVAVQSSKLERRAAARRAAARALGYEDVDADAAHISVELYEDVEVWTHCGHLCSTFAIPSNLDPVHVQDVLAVSASELVCHVSLDSD